MNKTKQCSKCGIIKSVTLFQIRKDRPNGNGYRSDCNECHCKTVTYNKSNKRINKDINYIAKETYNAILNRLKKQNAYKNVTICDEWLDSSNFVRWFIENYIDGYDIDKDLNGGCIYSPQTCLFIPRHLNRIMIKSSLPDAGVRQKCNKWEVRHAKQYYGVHESFDDAISLYRKIKDSHLKRTAFEYYCNDMISSELLFKFINYEFP